MSFIIALEAVFSPVAFFQYSIFSSSDFESFLKIIVPIKSTSGNSNYINVIISVYFDNIMKEIVTSRYMMAGLVHPAR